MYNVDNNDDDDNDDDDDDFDELPKHLWQKFSETRDVLRVCRSFKPTNTTY